jgi:hypothetical protein
MITKETLSDRELQTWFHLFCTHGPNWAQIGKEMNRDPVLMEMLYKRNKTWLKLITS